MDQQLRHRVKNWMGLPTRGEGQELLKALGLAPVTDLLLIRELLTEALQTVITPEQPLPAQEQKTKITPQINQAADPAALAPYIELLKAHSKTLLRERTTTHATLEHLDHSARYKAAERIKVITLQLDSLWDQIRELRSTGQVPASLLPGGSPYEQGVKDYKKYKTGLTRISQLRREIAKKRGKNQKGELTKKLRELEAELQPLKEKFKALII